MKSEILKILIEHQTSCKIGSDGDYTTEMCVFSDDFGDVAAAIEHIISARGESDGGKLAPEFVELIEIAEYMQNLYRNGRFGLSDEAMVTASAHLDDLRRIPSLPKHDQK